MLLCHIFRHMLSVNLCMDILTLLTASVTILLSICEVCVISKRTENTLQDLQAPPGFTYFPGQLGDSVGPLILLHWTHIVLHLCDLQHQETEQYFINLSTHSSFPVWSQQTEFNAQHRICAQQSPSGAYCGYCKLKQT